MSHIQNLLTRAEFAKDLKRVLGLYQGTDFETLAVDARAVLDDCRKERAEAEAQDILELGDPA